MEANKRKKTKKLDFYQDLNEKDKKESFKFNNVPQSNYSKYFPPTWNSISLKYKNVLLEFSTPYFPCLRDKNNKFYNNSLQDFNQKLRKFEIKKRNIKNLKILNRMSTDKIDEKLNAFQINQETLNIKITKNEQKRIYYDFKTIQNEKIELSKNYSSSLKLKSSSLNFSNFWINKNFLNLYSFLTSLFTYEVVSV